MDSNERARRAEEDYLKLQDAYRLLSALNAHVRKLLASVEFSDLDASERIDALARSVLPQTQAMFQRLAGPCICSIKIPVGARFRCVYAPNNSRPDLAEAISGIARKRSYAGIVMRTNAFLIVEDFSDFERYPEDERPPWTQAVKDAVERHDIRGVAMGPIGVKFKEDKQPESIAILKVDFLQEFGLLDNEATRELFDTLCSLIGVFLQSVYTTEKMMAKRRTKETYG